MSKGPALIITYSTKGIALDCHDGVGTIFRNIPDWLVPWMEAYIKNEPRPLSWKPPLNGLTPFTRKVLQELLNIPWGVTYTYKEIASSIHMPGAARAVGSACGRNPFLLIIPCHRVVGCRGLGGFSAGLEVKKRLLEHELGTPFASSLSQ